MLHNVTVFIRTEQFLNKRQAENGAKRFPQFLIGFGKTLVKLQGALWGGVTPQKQVSQNYELIIWQ